MAIWGANLPAKGRRFVRPGELSYRNEDVLGVGVWERIIGLTDVQVAGGNIIPAGSLVDDYGFELGDRFINARERLD